jgi:hypothetical protein
MSSIGPSARVAPCLACLAVSTIVARSQTVPSKVSSPGLASQNFSAGMVFQSRSSKSGRLQAAARGSALAAQRPIWVAQRAMPASGDLA